MGAYWATWSHFTVSNEPALISLPTGAGKTDLMIALSFAFKADRVLVVTPAEVLRHQTADRFRSMSLLKQLGVVSPGIPPPAVLSNDKQLQTMGDWNALREFDVVTATPKTAGSAEPGVCAPPLGLFDLVFLDEAHHALAPTWSALVKDFAKSKRVFLTATPFRRDRKRIQAPLVYHYPIAKALEDGIYSPIKFHPVESAGPQSRDHHLAAATAMLLRSQRKRGFSSKLLIRTDRVQHANALVGIYEQHKIRVRAVDYLKSSAENDEAIEMLKAEELDGLICVGMLGEGLDLPQLRIATLHAVPKSLPFTLQFVGRVTRTAANGWPSHLLAIPDDVKGEVRRLYRSESSWQQLVPGLVEKVIGGVAKRKTLRSADAFDELDLRLEDLKIFLSARIYALKRTTADLAAEIDLPEGVEEGLRENLADENSLVIITVYERQPAWARDTDILQGHYDLHVYYYSDENQLLFEATSNDSIAKTIRNAISAESASRLSHQDLVKVMQDSGSNYLMVGLRNTLGQASSHPAYKTYMGAEIQSTVRPSDGRAFAPGHALVRDFTGTTRGFGSAGSRVWSIKRTSIDEFRTWADQLAFLIRKKIDSAQGLPQLRFLASPQALYVIDDVPVAITMDPTPLLWNLVIRLDGVSIEVKDLDLLPFITATGLRNGALSCNFEFSSHLSPIKLIYRAGGLFHWEVAGDVSVTITIDKPDGDVEELELTDFLTEYPPVFVMPKGGTVVGSTYYVVQSDLPQIPKTILSSVDWEGCEITAETAKNVVNPEKVCIHHWVTEWLKQNDPDAIIVNDDLKGEIADLIAIHPKQKVIGFYHCKFSSRLNISTRITDAQEVIAQACRSVKWIATLSLLSELVARVGGSSRPTSIVAGSLASLNKLAAAYSPNEWVFEIVVVQPGFDSDALPTSRPLRPLLTSAYEWIKNCGANFRILGSASSN
jgi:superfamily II DNA or RNA helicase